jgi:hypothetical protein
MSNKHRDLWVAIFGRSPEYVYVKQYNYLYSQYLEEYLFNLFRLYNIDVLDQHARYTTAVVVLRGILEMIQSNREPVQLSEKFKTLAGIVRDYDEELLRRVQELAKLLNHPKLDEALVRLYPALSRLSERCQTSAWYDEKFVVDDLLPQLRRNRAGGIEIPSDKFETAVIFLDSFMYHNWKCFAIEENYIIGTNIITDAKPEVVVGEKYQKLKAFFNIDRPYEEIVNFCGVLNFSMQEARGLLPLVFDFRGYVCNFLASLVSKAKMPLFQIQPEKMYMLMKNLKNLDIGGEEGEVCRYENKNVSVGMLDLVGSGLDVIQCGNLDALLRVIEFIEQTSDCVCTLYVLCGQYLFSDVVLYEYLRRGNLTPLHELIVCRLWLNLGSVGNAERGALYYVCNTLEPRVKYMVTNLEFDRSYVEPEYFNVMLPPVLETIEDVYRRGEDISCHKDVVAESLDKFSREFLEDVVAREYVEP